MYTNSIFQQPINHEMISQNITAVNPAKKKRKVTCCDTDQYIDKKSLQFCGIKLNEYYDYILTLYVFSYILGVTVLYITLR